MADTSLIKTHIEPYVREWLSQVFPSHTFSERLVELTSGEAYKFDAVTADSSVVASILCNRPKTRTGRENTGGVRKALTEIGWLKALRRDTKKIMVFTDEGFCDLICRRGQRMGLEDIKMMVCPLPQGLKQILLGVLDRASREQRAAE